MRDSIVTAYALGIVTGAFISAGIAFAAPSHADPDNTSVAYAAVYGGIVCQVLDEFPTESGLLGVGDAIVEDGLTYRQAGAVIALAVSDICPRHTALLAQFTRHYGKSVA